MTDGPQFPEIVAAAMQKAWDEICSDTGCHPLDITHEGRKLFFHPQHWAALVAKYHAAEPAWRCTYCGFVLDLRWKAVFETDRAGGEASSAKEE